MGIYDVLFSQFDNVATSAVVGMLPSELYHLVVVFPFLAHVRESENVVNDVIQFVDVDFNETMSLILICCCANRNRIDKSEEGCDPLTNQNGFRELFSNRICYNFVNVCVCVCWCVCVCVIMSTLK